MDMLEVIRLNVFSPMVLAFILGIIAVVVKSDLEIPDQVYTLLSVYLLLAIGLKGGFELAKSADLTALLLPASAAVLLGVLIPLWAYFLLRRFGNFDVSNAAAIAIHYGAVSSVTLSVVMTFLTQIGQPFEGFMPAFYVILELPALVCGLMIYSYYKGGKQAYGEVIRAALTSKVFLLLGGGVLIGYISGETGYEQVAPFFVTLFPGMLTLFLLEMGMIVGKRLGDLRQAGVFLLSFAVLMPIWNGIIGVTLGELAGLSLGGSMILGTIAASASYIAAPTTVRANIPEANPGFYLTASLVITFPFNLIVGLPIYFEYAKWLHGVLN